MPAYTEHSGSNTIKNDYLSEGEQERDGVMTGLTTYLARPRQNKNAGPCVQND